VPRPHLNLSSRDVLVLERIHGVPISDNPALEAAGVNKALLAEKGVRTFFKQVFVDNFFHADMHPGNVFVDLSKPEDPRYIALDCAIIGSLTLADQQHLARSLVAFFNRDYPKVAQLYVEQGWTPPGTDVTAFAEAIERVCEPHFAKPLGEISFGTFLTDLFAVVESFDIRMQPQLVLLQKTLLYVEGLGRSLYPQLDLWQTAKPFMETWLIERNGPAAVASRTIKELPELLSALLSLPNLLNETASRLRALETLQADQTGRLDALESKLLAGRQVRRRNQWVAAALVTVGTLFLFGAFNDSAGPAPAVHTTFGAAGTLAGLALLLRTLIRF
jgi:ubiquinone biosynthesis protein